MRISALVLSAFVLAAGCIAPAVEDPSVSEADVEPNPLGLSFSGGVLDHSVKRTGEPSIAIDVDGTIYICAPAGAQAAAEDRDLNFIWRSDDAGASFKALPTTGRENAPGGGDCDIAIGPPGSLYEVGLHSVVLPMAITFTASDDQGESWRNAQMVSNAPVNDRQWIATHGGAIYVSWQQIDTGIWVAKSTDGGLTFPQQTLAMPRYANDKLQRYFIEGPTRIDPNDGTLYIGDGSQNGLDFWGLPNPADMHDRYGNVAVSENGGLTWTIKRTQDANPGWSFNIDRAGNLYSTGRHCDTDEAGNITGCFPQLYISKDRADTWQGPFNVTFPEGMLLAHMWVTAGSDGRVALATYATNQTNWAQENATGDWHLYMAGTMNALDGDDAEWFAARVVDEPVHQARMGRELVDFLSIVIHPQTGLPHFAYTSTFGKTKEDGSYGKVGHAQMLEGPSFLTAEDLARPMPVKT